MLQNNWPATFKSIKEKLKNCSRLKETAETEQSEHKDLFAVKGCYWDWQDLKGV